MTPEQHLWQRVVEQAFRDASNTGYGVETRINRDRAHSWIADNGRDFQMVCAMAGLDPDFLSESYRQGRFDVAIFRCPVGERRERARA